MAFKSGRHVCKLDGCSSKNAIWECDICGRVFCDDHTMDLDHVHEDIGIKENPTINLMYEQHVRTVCYDCMCLAELKEIDDVPDDMLPLLINRHFVTDKADNYYFRRVTGGTRDPHIFDFGIQIVKEMVQKVKEEECAFNRSII